MKYILLFLTVPFLAFSVQFLAAEQPVIAASVFENSCGDALKGHAGYNPDLAATDVCRDVNAQQDDSKNANPIVGIIKSAINVISIVVGVASVIVVLVASLRIITANGDSNSIGEARNGLLYALIGIAIVILAQAIVVFVLGKVD